MCNCLQELAQKHSKGYAQNGLDACVQVLIKGEIRIVPFIEDKDRWGAKTGRIRKTKNSKYESMPKFMYCPICGKPSNTTYVSLWYDEKGQRV